MNAIDYYFWINSDWAYLGADRLQEMAARHNVTVRHKPVDLPYIYSRTGGVPLGQRSAQRQAYRQIELARWMRRLGISINITPRHMCPNGDLASRFTIAADQAGLDAALLHKAVLRAQWCEEQDISDSRVLLSISQRLGLPGQVLMASAMTDEIGSVYRQYTNEAIEQGVFGSPAYIFDGELFWGQDRLDFLDEKIGRALAA